MNVDAGPPFPGGAGCVTVLRRRHEEPEHQYKKNPKTPLRAMAYPAGKTGQKCLYPFHSGLPLQTHQVANFRIQSILQDRSLIVDKDCTFEIIEIKKTAACLRKCGFSLPDA